MSRPVLLAALMRPSRLQKTGPFGSSKETAIWLRTEHHVSGDTLLIRSRREASYAKGTVGSAEVFLRIVPRSLEEAAIKPTRGKSGGEKRRRTNQRRKTLNRDRKFIAGMLQ